MSTGTAGSGSLPSSSAAGTSAQPAKRERYIERQLRRTRRQVRGVELASRLMLLAAAAVAFFLVAAVVDHWLVPGGLGIYGRLAFLAVFLVGAGWFAAHEIAPLFVYRINPLFAAQTIERAKPTLKNSLLNFLLLRSNRSGVPDVVLNAVEEQAAANLERMSIEHVVDRTRLVHIGYLLLAMVAAFCTYYLLSPKSPLQTVGRVVLPWSDLQPPSRVEIEDVKPGTTTVFRGERVSISAVVKPLQEGEAVTLYFSTVDRQSVDQPVRMYVAKDSYGRHTVTLPPAADGTALSTSAGLQQDIEYRIEAGDAVSRTYRLTVVQAPNIVVDKLDYAYPEYTRLDAETVEKTGDIRAVEGTQVTIHALANQPIASAYLDLGGDGRHKHPMQVTSGRDGGQRASASITLVLNDERTAPVFSHYFVRFATDRGHENREPIRHRIEVTPDPAPEVRLLKPDKVETAVPLNALLTFELEASDAQYGLADLRIVANVGGEPAFRRNRSVSRDDPSAARLVHKQPEQLDRITLAKGEKLKVGDVIEYWAEAVDNKAPQPNVTRSEVRKLVIVEPKQQPNPDQQQQQENDQGGDGGKKVQQDQNRQEGNDEQLNKPDGKNDPKNNDQKSNDQKDSGQKNEQAKNDDRKNKGGEKGRGGQDESQSKNDHRQPNDSNGKSEEDDNNTESPQKSGDGKGGADRDASGNQKSNENKSAKGTASDQRKGDQAKNERDDSSAGDTSRNEQPNQAGERSRTDNPQRQHGQQKDESQPVDKSDDGGAFKRILDHAKEKDGKSPERPNNAQEDQRPAPGERGSEPNKSDDANQKGANADRKNGQPASDNTNQTNRDSQPGARDEQHGKSGDSENERTPNEKSKQSDTQKTTAGAQKDDGSKTGRPETAQEDDSQKNAKSGAAEDDQRKRQDGADDKTGGEGRSREQDSRPMVDDPQPTQQGAKDGDDTNEKSQNSGAKAERDDAYNAPSDDQRKGASGLDEKRDDSKTANEKTAGTDAQKTDNAGAEKQDGSKSGTAASSQKSEKSPSNGQKGPSKDGSRADKTNGQRGQPPNEKDGDGKSPKDGQPGDMPPDDGNDKRDTPDGAPDGKGTASGGVGGPRRDSAPPPDGPRVSPEDDKANLEYAKRATDLALDHLRNQLKDERPDQELLDRLGWSKEDLQKLLSRWEKLEREAKQPGPASTKAKDNLQEAIKSLGLRPGKTARKASTNADDATRALRDSARSAPPPEYADQYRAFKKRTSQGEK